jgi:hypothetical protein
MAIEEVYLSLPVEMTKTILCSPTEATVRAHFWSAGFGPGELRYRRLETSPRTARDLFSLAQSISTNSSARLSFLSSTTVLNVLDRSL